MHHQFHARRPPGWLGRESATSDFSHRFQPAAMKSKEDPASLTFSLSLSLCSGMSGPTDPQGQQRRWAPRAKRRGEQFRNGPRVSAVMERDLIL